MRAALRHVGVLTLVRQGTPQRGPHRRVICFAPMASMMGRGGVSTAVDAAGDAYLLSAADPADICGRTVHRADRIGF